MKKTSLFTCATAGILALLSGCTVLGEVAYDSAAQLERQRCDRLESTPERKACMERARTAIQQSEEARRKN